MAVQATHGGIGAPSAAAIRVSTANATPIHPTRTAADGCGHGGGGPGS